MARVGRSPEGAGGTAAACARRAPSAARRKAPATGRSWPGTTPGPLRSGFTKHRAMLEPGAASDGEPKAGASARVSRVAQQACPGLQYARHAFAPAAGAAREAPDPG